VSFDSIGVMDSELTACGANWDFSTSTLKRLSDLGDRLEVFWAAVDFELFRAELDVALGYSESGVWADTAYRSAASAAFLIWNGFVSHIHCKKRKAVHAGGDAASQQCEFDNPLAHRACVRRAEGAHGFVHPNRRHRTGNDQDRPRNLVYNIKRLLPAPRRGCMTGYR
jgi:hypothetical protein